MQEELNELRRLYPRGWYNYERKGGVLTAYILDHGFDYYGAYAIVRMGHAQPQPYCLPELQALNFNWESQ